MATHVHAHTRSHSFSDASLKREHYRLMLARGTNIEAKEHKTLTLTQAMQVAKDHLKENPHFYDGNWKSVTYREGITD